jgi:hypothetical protein
MTSITRWQRSNLRGKLDLNLDHYPESAWKPDPKPHPTQMNYPKLDRLLMEDDAADRWTAYGFTFHG